MKKTKEKKLSQNKIDYKRKFTALLLLLLAGFVLVAAAMIIVDPYFHYHKPLSFLSYELTEERYINDGISRHFEFDGIITGTSMNQNFKTSEAEELFGGAFVKETFSGAGFKELMSNLERSFEYNPGIKRVIWGMDYNGIRRDADYEGYPDYPDYLYDDNPFNDIKYIFNKNILYSGTIRTLIRTAQGLDTMSFDEYSAWVWPTGFEHIMEDYNRQAAEEWSEQIGFDWNKELEKARENMEINVIPVIEAHPETDFYIFFSPYSIIYWDSLNIEGTIELQLETEKNTAKQLLEYENVHLFCFFENTALICNLEEYNNKEHYSAKVNSQILDWMAAGEYELTLDNLEEHMQHMAEFYVNYDYDGLFASYGYGD